MEAAAGEELHFLATYAPLGGQPCERPVTACPKCKDNDKEMHRLGVRAGSRLLTLQWPWHASLPACSAGASIDTKSV